MIQIKIRPYLVVHFNLLDQIWKVMIQIKVLCSFNILILMDIMYVQGFSHNSVGKESTCNAGGPHFNSWVGKIHWRRNRLPTPVLLGFPCGSAGKESSCNVGDLGSIPGLRRSPGEGKGYPLQYSGPENSMNCIVHGVAKSQTWLSNFHFSARKSKRNNWYMKLVSVIHMQVCVKWIFIYIQ